MAALLDGTELPPELNANILQHLGSRLDVKQLLTLCGVSRSAREAIKRSSLAVRFARSVLGAGYGRWTTVLQVVAQRCPAVFELEFSSCDIDSIAVSHLRASMFPALSCLRLLRCYHLRAPYDAHSSCLRHVATPDNDFDDNSPEPQGLDAEEQHVQLREFVALNLNILDNAGFSLHKVHTLVMTGCESSMDGAQAHGLLNLLENEAPHLRHLFLGGAKLQLYSKGRALSIPQLELCEMTFWDDELKLQAASFLPNAKIVDLTSLKTFDCSFHCHQSLPWDCAVECRGPRGVRPLHLAAIAGDDEAVSWLLSMGADYNAKDAKGCTALFRACQHGSTKAAQCLLKAGADFILQNQSMETPLYIASLCGFFGCVEALLAADVGAGHDQLARFNYFDGWSPLHAACLKGSFEIADALLAAGFNANALNKWRQTPMHVVARSGNIALAELLYLRSGSNAAPSKDKAVDSCDRCKAVDAKTDTTATGSAAKRGDGDTPLEVTPSIEIDQVDVDGLTPAQIAHDRGHESMVVWLTQRGAAVPSMNAKAKPTGRRRRRKKKATLTQGHNGES